MKKSTLAIGIVYVFAGCAFLFAALSMHSELDGLLCGFAGAMIGLGISSIFKYCYWTSPKHEKEYHEKWKQEQIELHDELKEKLRDKSGRYAYVLGLVVVGIAIPVFAVLNQLHLIESSSVLVIFLFFYLIFQYVAGVVIFKFLLKKYE